MTWHPFNDEVYDADGKLIARCEGSTRQERRAVADQIAREHNEYQRRSECTTEPSES